MRKNFGLLLGFSLLLCSCSIQRNTVSRGDGYGAGIGSGITKVSKKTTPKNERSTAEVDALYEKDLSKINYITGEFHNFIGKENQSKLFGWISNTHNEIHSVGDGVGSHFIKMWKRK